MNARCLVALLSAFFAILCNLTVSETPPAADSGTGVEGVISISPIHGGPTRLGIPDSRPFANVAFVVENEKGAVTSFTTDDQGRFRLSLAPGHYTVSRKDRKGGIGHFGPFDVDVVAGQFTKVAWACDSGMR